MSCGRTSGYDEICSKSLLEHQVPEDKIWMSFERKMSVPSANADIAELTKLMSVWTGLYLIIRSEKNW